MNKQMRTATYYYQKWSMQVDKTGIRKRTQKQEIASVETTAITYRLLKSNLFFSSN